MTIAVESLKVPWFPVIVVSVQVMQLYFVSRKETIPTGFTYMALLLQDFHLSSVVEFRLPFAPVREIPIVWASIPNYHDVLK